MNNPLTPILEEAKEQALEKFLGYLTQNVFVKSTNSITDEVEELTPKILDMEAIITISGEWDREDLKNILIKSTATTIINAAIEELNEKISEVCETQEEWESLSPDEKDGETFIRGKNEGITTAQDTLRAMIKKINE